MTELLNKLGGKNVANIPAELKEKGFKVTFRLVMLSYDIYILSIVNFNCRITHPFYKKVYPMLSFNASKITTFLAHIVITSHVREDSF